ncbi:PI31 proteasome regulator N-terminal-domain-containing protein [Fimicolochytrium jonesii]|uniref:PI31 proteasome regulator N-terminal-domain-containing protein n=1 Tax=Fimicolochytrium jonesii TaxID=1396493 RepID=UPI0022FE9703|nr:PI31 proteasome regulator N-terminal-domain-containing protein [Fimicolochytrium jonesii]KAI8818960.1 PI31 proteasome regulator N-terminal-domain-containing protein [Fimicolochytrium jonesii]
MADPSSSGGARQDSSSGSALRADNNATTGDNENPLEPKALLRTLIEALPQTGGKFTMKSPADLTVALFHAAMSRYGFRFIGVGEERKDHADYPDTDQASVVVRSLPSDWNATGDMFSFRYKHSQSSLTFLLKCVKVGKNKLIVHGMGIEDEKLHTIELAPGTFISEALDFPFEIQLDAEGGSRGGAVKKVESAFASEDQLYAVLREFRVGIMQKLIPGLNKPGYEPDTSSSRSTAASSSSRDNTQNRPRPPYFYPITGVPYPEGEDEHRTGPLYSPFRNPHSVGDVDLDPFGALGGPFRPPLFSGTGGPGGFGGGGGGMFVGPDHPMFGGRGFPEYGGDGMLPPGAAPPGARYDPIMPPGIPGPGRPQFPSRGGFGRGGGRGGFGGAGWRSGDPDNDELPPPGFEDDMFM